MKNCIFCYDDNTTDTCPLYILQVEDDALAFDGDKRILNIIDEDDGHIVYTNIDDKLIKISEFI